MDYRDLACREISVGDCIVYSALLSRSAVLKYGVVKSLETRKDGWSSDKLTPTLRVVTVDRSYTDNWQLQNNGKPVTLGFLDRLLVIQPEMLPEAVRDLLGV